MNAERNNTSRLLSFEKLHNIRDLGGVAASDGRRIISGKLVRCGNLSELSDRDRVAFSSLAEEVIDFRTDGISAGRHCFFDGVCKGTGRC